MILKAQTLHSRMECEALLSTLRNLQYSNKIKLISGSFEPNGYAVVTASFKLKGTTQFWQLSGVIDQNGGLSLSAL